MIERRIKELSIALEALSRIHTGHDQYRRIESLLDKAIDEAEEPQKPYTRPRTTTADEIPF